MKNRVFKHIVIPALIVLSVLFLVFTAAYCGMRDRKNEQNLKREITLVAQTATTLDEIKNARAEGLRIMLIDEQGLVVYDSGQALLGEDFSQKSEVKKALEKGSCFLTCSTENKRTDCFAVSVGSLGVLRGSREAFGAKKYFSECYFVFIIYLVSVTVCIVLGYNSAKRVVKPLKDLQAEKLVDANVYKEINPILRSLNDQKLQLKWQQAELMSKTEQFKTVVTNMNEGLVLLDQNENIELINFSAQTVLGDGGVGESYTTLKYADKIAELLKKIKSEERAEEVIEDGNFSYQLSVKLSKVYGEIKGYVILVFDVSEKEKSEQMRREFTANVSHELKTPLHSISGCAELLSSGLVKPEDTKQFTSQIYSEAKRMIQLVDDILKVSSLDEGASEMQREEVDLLAVATETVNNLEMEAISASVKLEVSGESAAVYGIKHLLSGIIYNLCDNAIKYNKENGYVKVKVKNTDSGAELTVKDNGIGIPSDHHSRIFERFYRVDKSHSKEVGGTGLGLSIVKHAVRLHDAEIKIKSQVGKGTKFTVNFPKR